MQTEEKTAIFQLEKNKLDEKGEQDFLLAFSYKIFLQKFNKCVIIFAL